MNEGDMIHKAFVIKRGIYCYKVMPFRLKNAGATYQRLISKMFLRLMRVTVKAYIDDIVIKSQRAQDHIRDANEVFKIFRKFLMKLIFRAIFGTYREQRGDSTKSNTSEDTLAD